MNIVCSIALDTLSLIYMLILIFNIKHKHRRELLTYQYFLLTVAVCLLLVSDIAYMCFYGSTSHSSHILMKLFKSIYFVVNSVIVWLWAKYVDCMIFNIEYRSHKHRIFYLVVLIINVTMSVCNVFSDLLCKISPAGEFEAMYAPLSLFTLLNYLSLTVAMLILVNNTKKIAKCDLVPMLLFPLPALGAEIVQLFYRPFSLISAYAVSALIVFQLSQNKIIFTDPLTGLGNRRLFDDTMKKWFALEKSGTVCGVMIDLDRLKYINDTYGHLCGDNALLLMAEIIRSVDVRKDIISARYGGDEFILVWFSQNGDADIAAVEHQLEEIKVIANRSKAEHEKIDFSMGSFCCAPDGVLTSEDFIKNIDDAMYQRKKEKQLKK